MDQGMKALSIIIPFCNEYPQIAFTIQDLYCELEGQADFEIIAVNNYCEEVKQQGYEEDKGFEYLASIAKSNSWLKVLKYDAKLSHWNAKNAGVNASSGDILFFCDAHCIVSRNALFRMYEYYAANHEALNGTLHLPLSYLLERPGLELIYKLDADAEKGTCHYKFTRYRPADTPYQVPCMSTCGMMMTREIFDILGGWPEALGIYGGGENFINFSIGVMGKTINIFPGSPLYHYAEKRGYHWNYTDWVRNRCIAAYLHGGKNFAGRFISNVKGRPPVLESIYHDVIKTCGQHRDRIKKHQQISTDEFIAAWLSPGNQADVDRLTRELRSRRGGWKPPHDPMRQHRITRDRICPS
jgi:glycosyltransferase involved in cell wall biosynthesis